MKTALIERLLLLVLDELRDVKRTLHTVINKENRIMAFQDDILAAIADEDTAVDSVIAFIKANPVIPDGVKQQILGQIAADKARLNAALVANVPPAGLAFPANGSTGTVGQPYSNTFAAVGGTAPISYAVSSGTAPSWATLGVGTLTGTPDVAGVSTFSVTATDSASPANTATAAFTITVS